MTTPPLQIYDTRERALVRVADLVLAPLGWGRRGGTSRQPARVLLLRLERIGDLLMTVEAIADARRVWPAAAIDLAVGSWNVDLARMIPGVSSIRIADVPWLSRGERPTSWPGVLAEARRWRHERYDLVINFEPDIRTNLLAWLTGAPVRAGYSTGGGGAFLTVADAYDPTSHTAVNARRLVARVSGTKVPATAPASGTRIDVPDVERAAATSRWAAQARPWIGIHASGGRESKQWHPDRFASVGRALAAATGGTIVLTGGPSEQALVARVSAQLAGVPHVTAVNAGSLRDAAGVLAALDVYITGDTGPMHLAAAVGTPVVALFGPSNPVRYGPRAALERVVRIDLPCSPCGQVRLPPERCRGHVPDCLDGITVDTVVRHALDLLAERGQASARI